MKECVIVTGMHRSGTSVCAAAVSALGYELGEIGDYKDAENPKGYFENFDIVALNDDILNTYNASWYTLNRDICSQISEDKLEKFLTKAISILTSCFNDYDKLVIKDPRICILLPFWQKVFARFEHLKVSYVLLIRDPVEVSISQQKRNVHNPDFFKLGKELAYTQLLWFHYYREFFKHFSSDDKLVLVSHHDLLSNPVAELDKLEHSLCAKGEAASRECFLEEVFSKDLYRSVASKTVDESSSFSSVYQTLLSCREIVDIELVKHLVSQITIDLQEEKITSMLVELTTQLIRVTSDEQQKFKNEFELMSRENIELTRLLADARCAYSNLENEFTFANRLLTEERTAHQLTDNALSEAQNSLEKFIEDNKRLTSLLEQSNELLRNEAVANKESKKKLEEVDISGELSSVYTETKVLLEQERISHRETHKALGEAQEIVKEYLERINDLSSAFEQMKGLLEKERLEHRITDNALAQAQKVVKDYETASEEPKKKLEEVDKSGELSSAYTETKLLLEQEIISHRVTHEALGEAQEIAKAYLERINDLSIAFEQMKELLEKERAEHRITDNALGQAQKIVKDYEAANKKLSLALEQCEELLKRE